MMKEKLEKIKMLILDVDGVLTDGSIIVGDDGMEHKIFNVQDGHGIKLFQRAGYKTAIISGRETQATEIRAKQLGINLVYQNCKKKLPVFEQILKENSLSPDEICFVGDDLLDIPLVRRAGFGVAVANAIDELKEFADYVTDKKGGKGAVREVIELILKNKDNWDGLIERYLI